MSTDTSARSVSAVTDDANTAPAFLLSNGRYGTLLTRCGAGYSAFAGRALTRWTPDRLRQLQGFFFYLRDLDNHACWSAGFEPIMRMASLYDVQVGEGRVVITREGDGIETRVEICISPADDVELRRLTVTNSSGRQRSLDVTTYLELVLNDLRGDAAHPAFSKLFVQTAFSLETETVLAWRRLRAPDEEPLWVAHRLLGGSGVLTFETDRMRFLGRGRTTANPRALDAPSVLSGTAGNVLDPVFSLRRELRLDAGQTASLTAVLACGADRHSVEQLVARYASESAIAAGFAAALVQHHVTSASVIALTPPYVLGGKAAANWNALGFPAAWLNALAAGPLLVDGNYTADSSHAFIARETDPRSKQRADGGAQIANTSATAAAAKADEVVADSPQTAEPLQFFNGFGGFSQDGREYVIRLTTDESGLRYPPLPWTNVVANEQFGFIASESGGGYTWAGNSRRNRITTWSNDPVSDPPSEVIYLRDDDTGAYWSATPAPASAAADYEVRHGFGYTLYRHTAQQLEHELCLFVPRHDPVKVARLTVHNASTATRRLTAYAYARLVLGAKAQETAPGIVTRFDAAAHTLYAQNQQNENGAVAFATLNGGNAVHATADRGEFLGSHGSLNAPAAVVTGATLDGPFGDGLDPCAALQTTITLAPHGTVSISFLLGETANEHTAATLVRSYRDAAHVAQAYDDVRAFWSDTVGAVQIDTPARELDLMVNGWLAYQTMSCRLWGRSAFYQSGGAFGFRDQLQDTSALVYLAPALTRAQILLHAAHQFREGDVLHWWHPPESLGIRTRFSDDLLWLPYITAFYVRATGDDAVLDERVHYLEARELAAEEDEIAVIPRDSGDADTVYDHCCRAIDRSLTQGAHGLPLIGTGDWNDGMNRVGREGRGESVWLGFFLYDILDDVIPLCEHRGDHDRAIRYRTYQHELHRALNDGGWDGAWYRRAYYDDGAPIGSSSSDECRIDAIAQAWAVLSGVAPQDRADSALDALEHYLVDEEHALIRLLTPPFDCTPHDPGYIKGYLPGVRENGGQYTHGALWAVRALAEAGRHERATRLLELLSPVSHGRTAEEVETYRAEPYVIAADVYSEPPHTGRAGWTWYTGSSGWMLRVALESILGFELERGPAIRLTPHLPGTWPGYTVTYRPPGRDVRFIIEVTRDGHGVAVNVNGARIAGQDGGYRIEF